MEFKIYRESGEFLRENGTTSDETAAQFIRRYSALDTKNYAFKFTDGSDILFVLRAENDMLVTGSENLAEFASNVVADYHLEVCSAEGDRAPLEVFFTSYAERMGGTYQITTSKKHCRVNYIGGKIRQALFAGGCFWCMAKPYYEYDGVKRVFSGYAGGDVVNPSYEQVKTGLTRHKETVMLEYDSGIITFKELLDVYFDTIDPFDEGGQFIDRGDNYTCAIFTDDQNERKVIEGVFKDIESECKRKVQVKILSDSVFYKAEEYHQDYALKNPDAMAEELKTSGRLNRTCPLRIKRR